MFKGLQKGELVSAGLIIFIAVPGVRFVLMNLSYSWAARLIDVVVHPAVLTAGIILVVLGSLLWLMRRRKSPVDHVVNELKHILDRNKLAVIG